MRCDLSISDTRKSILPFQLVDGSHLDRGQREYSRSEDRRKAVGGKTSTAFSFAPNWTLPVTIRVLPFIPPAPDHTLPAQEALVKSLRGMPANYRIATGRGKVPLNRHSMGDWERGTFTDTKALGRVHLDPDNGRGVAVAKDRQRAEQRELLKMMCSKCRKREAYWSASWCEPCIWRFVQE
jgi:hypothetical protein